MKPEAPGQPGLANMILLILSRNWLRLLVWTAALAGMIALVYESQRAAFPTQADREAYAMTADTPSVAALTGTPYAADTLGGILILKIWMTLAVSLAFATIFLVTRNGRADEEAGRTELLRSNVLGRHAYSLANYVVAGALNLVAGAAVAGTAAAVGLPAAGSLVLGASLAGVGLFFLGVAAVCGQLASTSRGANGLAAAVLGLAFVLRAAGDLEGTDLAPGWTSWLSPLGWGQQMRAFGADRWWPLLPLTVGAALLCALAVRWESRRDLGSGMLPERPGKPRAGPFTLTGFGLAVRLQRGSILGWCAAIVVMALLYGSVASAMADLLAGNALFTAVLGPDTSAETNSVLGWLVMLNAVAASAFAVESTLQMRTEELSGRAAAQLAGNVSRLRWAAGWLLLPVIGSAVLLMTGGAAMGAAYGAPQDDPSQAWVLLGAALAYWPGVLVTAGVAVLLIGVAPRTAASLAWTFFSVLAIVSIFGPLFSLPAQITGHTPLTATPRLPADSFTGLPLLVLTAVALAAWTAGLARFAGRDLVQER